jgi:cobalt-zinc-cadmium resistance protein CzcA
MIDQLLRFSIRHRSWVCLLTLGWFVWALLQLRHLPIDAVPDVTNRQVQLNTLAPALGAEEVERRVTFPVELALAGIPQVVQSRSISQFGLSQITLIFQDTTDIYFARQLVGERLNGLSDALPAGCKVEMAPISTGIGEIYYFRLKNPNLSLRQRRTLMDWVVRPALKGVEGLADVNIWGGEARQIEIELDPIKLKQYGFSVSQVARAVERNNANGSGALMRVGPEQLVVRTLGTLQDPAELEKVVISEFGSVPVLLGQVAQVQEGSMVRQGAVTSDGKGEEVYGIALLLLGQNSRQVVERVKERLAVVEKALPPGSQLEGFLDRSKLVQSTLKTAMTNLLEGGALVAALLFLFLLQWRAGLIVSSAIPLALLVATTCMYYFGISANLMSLGAIDFGLVVDGSVIIVENCLRRMALRRQSKGADLNDEESLEEIVAGAAEVRRATLLGEILIVATYLPILSLQGIEGKMFRPMGLTVIFALLGAFVLSFTTVPALCAYFLRGQGEVHHPLLERLTSFYQRHLERWLQWPKLVGLTATVMVLAGSLVFLGLGSEFIPDLEEGALAVQVTYPTSISLNEAVRQGGQVERALMAKFPKQIAKIVTRIGRPEIATDPMLTCQTDVLVDLKPNTYQRPQLVMAMSKFMQESFPDLEVTYTQPIKMRMMELIEGVGIRSDLGIKIYGSEHAVLRENAEKMAAILKQVPGAADVQVEITEGLPQLQIGIDRAAISRHGISIADVNEVVELLLGNRPVSTINDGNQRCDIVLRLPAASQNDPNVVAGLPIPSAAGFPIPLDQIAKVERKDSPVQISRENGKRRMVVQANVRGRDLGSFVEEVKARLDKDLKLPTGYYLEYGGTYEKMRSGRARLALVVPLTFGLVLGLLYFNFRDVRLALLVFTGIPFSVVGGVLALWLRGLAVSISALIGFVALAGIAVLNGVVMLTFIQDLCAQGLPLRQAILQGAVTRLRPVLMTASVAGFGFLPMALSHGAGAEVQRPLATVVIGGILTSTVLTLVVLPVLTCAWWSGRKA